MGRGHRLTASSFNCKRALFQHFVNLLAFQTKCRTTEVIETMRSKVSCLKETTR